jgi:NitT/TauT family transport system ATP-binding protein
MSNQRKEILKLKDVSLTYHTQSDEILALQNISFSVYEHEFVAIVGPSGCGKTTILSLISGILKVSSGHIYLDGQEITKPSGDIGYMFQRDHLFEWRSIWKNVILGLEIQKKTKNKELIEKVNQLIKKYGLASFKNKKPFQLSGGMRQRVALIRTLALEPKILLLDEPFSALDFQTRLSVCDSVSNIIEMEKKTAILVTHDIAEAISMADRVIILSSRPGTVKRILEINLKHLGPPIKRRESEQAHKLFDEIWKDLITYNPDESYDMAASITEEDVKKRRRKHEKKESKKD